jgi:predicted RNase H-like nuclease (RuvC/YqgF family)
MIKWFKTNKKLREILNKKQEEIDNLRNDWFLKRKEISDLKRELMLARRMWDISDKTKKY